MEKDNKNRLAHQILVNHILKIQEKLEINLDDYNSNELKPYMISVKNRTLIFELKSVKSLQDQINSVFEKMKTGIKREELIIEEQSIFDMIIEKNAEMLSQELFSKLERNLHEIEIDSSKDILN